MTCTTHWMMVQLLYEQHEQFQKFKTAIIESYKDLWGKIYMSEF